MRCLLHRISPKDFPDRAKKKKFSFILLHEVHSHFDGTIDEPFFVRKSLAYEEAAEAYRAGRDHYLNKTISSTDLSGKQTLPFYVAADRPGTYLEATVGENAFANYQPDSNTVGLWHLAEQSGSGEYIKDSSGNSNHGTPTGTTFTQGKIGKGRNFAGSSSHWIGINSPTSGITAGGVKTVSAWINTSLATDEVIFNAYDGTNGYQIYVGGGAFYSWSNGGATLSSSTVVNDGKWHYVVAVLGWNRRLFIC
ncbi:hypothetical protein A3A79_01850 [Candidatus Gottesmanbacteria bacterium RIFCSPLOWO2_01_FULL_43_11b]|uniref:Laminin G domain-containing protein n=1 Tax=Candidatus Gottesmanbacteria bacterium RIFCSPLOWO2_01_FULL_43_11b TaxID=1798392 RepID=A0A1F6AGS0_9BACT|nr:MAG: hypothetical protein A3A79_01850 [Candidatus Gottesmanbacteria bacterium RIFCSPLOWO2_01_FULL_43_11b]